MYKDINLSLIIELYVCNIYSDINIIVIFFLCAAHIVTCLCAQRNKYRLFIIKKSNEYSSLVVCAFVTINSKLLHCWRQAHSLSIR